MDKNTFLITLSSAAAFLLMYFSIFFFIRGRSKKKSSRRHRPNIASKAVASLKKNHLFQGKRQSIVEKKLNQYLSHFRSENWLQLQLYRAGLSFSIIQIIVTTLLLSAFSTYILFLLGLFSFSGSLYVSLLSVCFLEWLIIAFLRNRRKKNIIKILPTAIDIILRSLQSGYSVERTFDLIAKEMDNAVSKEFEKISQQLDVGVSYDDALRRAAERVHTSDFYFLANSLIIQHLTGGSLSKTLENILFLLRRRHEIRLKTLALSAEAKTTGIILGSVPVIIWIVIMFMKPEYMDFFLYEETGNLLLKVIIGLLALEAIIIKWITNIKVD